jgi:hypothetical protein
MKNKSFVLLIAVLVVLVLTYVIQQFSTGHKTISETLVKLFPDVDSASVAYIRVYKADYPDSGIGFAKKDTGWIVSSYYGGPGKKAEIEKIIGDVVNLTGEVRSSDQALLGDFGLGDKEALHFEFYKSDSTLMRHFLAGKGLANAARSSFVRNFNDNTVYKANENLISRFAMWDAPANKRITVDRWLDLKMANIVADSVKAFNLNVKGKAYSFIKETEMSTDTLTPAKSNWKQVEPTKGKILESKDILDILNRLGRLRGSDILRSDNLASLGLDKPTESANLVLEDGRKFGFVFGAMADTTKARYAVMEGNPFIYKVAGSICESIFENPFNPPKKDAKKK